MSKGTLNRRSQRNNRKRDTVEETAIVSKMIALEMEQPQVKVTEQFQWQKVTVCLPTLRLIYTIQRI